jgi:predicted ATPase/DNA-binding SARP family transcriptional activator
VQVRVLGALEARDGSDVIAIRPAERRLLAALVACRRAPVRYDALAEAVWGEEVPRSATRSLQTHVLRLRSSLGDDAVETVPGGYRLGAGVAVDADVFVNSVRNATTVDRADSVAATLAAWDAAVSLWQGVPFDELSDWPPAIPERARLIELWHDALEQRCAAALNVRPAGGCVAEAEAMVLAEPLRERRWVLLMTALAAAGRRADALRAYDRARRILASELGISPGTELSRLHDSLLREDVEPDVIPRSSRGNLPATVSSLIGRDEEIDLVVGLLQGHRLVTLTGPGGVGKSRLAIAAAEAARDRFPGGAWLVELAATGDSDGVEAVIASALGVVPTGEGATSNTVIQAIGDRALLVVLDNCEHRLAAVADVVTDLLARCSRLCILTTSREPLAVPGEQTRRLASLPVDGAAAELFTARAREADAGFVSDDPVALARVLTHLDGIPLAIELAAAQVHTLGITGLAARLDAKFELLPTPRRGRDERHRTVRAAIDWSHDLLDEPERVVFERLSVFSGRFELAAVDPVVNSGDVDDDTSALLASLVEKSMIVADGAGDARFRMLEPLRQYARQRLDARGETTAAVSRHRQYYAELAVQLADHRPWGDEITATRRITAARENFRAACATALELGDVATAVTISYALARYALLQIWSEPWTWSERALALPAAADHPMRAAALVVASGGAWQLGDHERSVAFADEAIGLSEPGGDVWREAQQRRASALVWLGRTSDAVAAANASAADDQWPPRPASLDRLLVAVLIRNVTGDPDPAMAVRLLEEARAVGHPTTLALALHAVGAIVVRDDDAVAAEYQREAARLAAETGAKLIEGFALSALAGTLARNDPAAGARAEVDVMAHYLRLGNRNHLRSFGRSLVRILIELGLDEAAAVLDGATSDQPEFTEMITGNPTHIDTARARLGPGYDTAFAQGAAMTDDELVAYLDGILGNA